MWLPNVKTLCGGEGRLAGSGSSKASRRATRRAKRPRCEDLEGRALLSGVTAILNNSGIPKYGPANVLVITGDSGNDTIRLSESFGLIWITGASAQDQIDVTWYPPGGGGWSSMYGAIRASDVSKITISTGSGNDTVNINRSLSIPTFVYAGSGTDSLTTGGSNDTFFSGTGSDTYVSIGGTHNIIFGGVGTSAPDSFWYDSGTEVYFEDQTEQNLGMIHPIANFAPLWTGNGSGGLSLDQPTNQLDGQALPSPTPLTKGLTEQNFSSNPLFESGGPSPNDVTQGAIGDCPVMAALLGIATRDPARIEQMIVSLGDGTYAVDFNPGGVNTYIRVDADLPVSSPGSPVYAQLGQQGALWVALIEKAWTYERPVGGSYWTDNVGTYNVDQGGSAGELLAGLNQTINGYTSNLFDQVISDQQAGKIVCLSTDSTTTSASGLVADHWYYVDHLNYATIPYFPVPGHGYILRFVVSITVRNPWGGSNPWVTITPTDVSSSVYSEMSSTVP